MDIVLLVFVPWYRPITESAWQTASRRADSLTSSCGCRVQAKALFALVKALRNYFSIIALGRYRAFRKLASNSRAFSGALDSKPSTEQ